MKYLLILFAITIALLFVTCAESPVEPEPPPTSTELITQNGYWKNQTLFDPPFFGVDEMVIYFHFDKDGNGLFELLIFTEGEEIGKNYEPFAWLLVEENDTENVSHLYLHLDYNKDFSPQPWVVEIISLDKNKMILKNLMPEDNLVFDFQHN